MPRGRIAANDYEDCILSSIPIPNDLHIDLKVWCAKNKKTMKEVLYDLNVKGIKEILGVDKNE